MRDAGIQFQDIRYAFDDTWQETSKGLKEKGISPTGKLPVLEYKGKLLSQVSKTAFISFQKVILSEQFAFSTFLYFAIYQEKWAAMMGSPATKNISLTQSRIFILIGE